MTKKNEKINQNKTRFGLSVCQESNIKINLAASALTYITLDTEEKKTMVSIYKK